MSNRLLTELLPLAVAAQLDRLHRRGGPKDLDWETLEQINLELAEQGDVLLYGGGKPGEAARLFNQLAYALAVLAHARGGVSFMGLHWEAEPVEQIIPKQLTLPLGV